MIGTCFGATVFLAFVALATHTLIGLYATSTLGAVAWDGARRVATHPDDVAVQQEATEDAQRRLGGLDEVEVAVQTEGSAVSFRVSAKRPTFLPKAMARATSLERVGRTAVVRVEDVQ